MRSLRAFKLTYGTTCYTKVVSMQMEEHTDTLWHCLVGTTAHKYLHIQSSMILACRKVELFIYVYNAIKDYY